MYNGLHESIDLVVQVCYYGVVTLRDYTTAQVARLSGFSVRQLDSWARQELIEPSIQPAHGRGSIRRYALEDLMQLRFIRQLKSQGWSMQKIRKAVAKLREVMDDPHPLKTAVLFDGKGTLLALCKTKEGEHVLLAPLSGGGQQVMWIVLEALMEDTRTEIEDRIMLAEVSMEAAT